MIPKFRTAFTIACLLAFTLSLGCGGGEVNSHLKDSDETGPVELPAEKPSDKLLKGPA